MWVDWSFPSTLHARSFNELLQSELRMNRLHFPMTKDTRYFNTLHFPSLDQWNSHPWLASFRMEFLTVLSPEWNFLPSSLHSTASPPPLSIPQPNFRTWRTSSFSRNPLPQTLSHQCSLTTASWVPGTDIHGCPLSLRQQHASLLCVSQWWMPRSFLNSFQEPWV